MSDYRLTLTWHWDKGAEPSASALEGFEILMKYLGFVPERQGISPQSYSLRLAPAGRPQTPPTPREAEGELRAWARSLLSDYPGSRWEVERTPPRAIAHETQVARADEPRLAKTSSCRA